MPLKPVYYIYGTDGYLVEESLAKIRKEALSGPFASMNFHAFEGKGLDAGELVSTASTLPAFAEWRLVVVKGAEAIKAAEEKRLASYVANPSPSTCLVFMSNAAKLEKGSELVKALEEKGYLKACNRLRDAELLKWIRDESSRQGKSTSGEAARRLLEIAGNSLRDVKGELDKIILFIGDKPAIDEKDIEESGLECGEESVFGLSDAIGRKDLKEAMKAYRRLSDEEPIKVLGAVARQMRTLLRVKALLRKGTPAARIASVAGLFPRHAEDYVKRSRLFGEPELKAAILKLLAADTDLKSGRAPSATVLPRLIMELCGKAPGIVAR
ncbi:MAG: DNA polymerase III subunit delta [Thermodesulfobacteriota bacterium]|nr:MAG: DNA polymerase III subunit delta [Thermodesulfobacteriota bacterium]